jgi:uncharacterized membrane protein required for colicin V production
MVSLSIVLGMFMVVFALIGALRGWAKEMLVAFSMILALFMFYLINQIGFFSTFLNDLSATARFTFQVIYMAVFAMFGYAGPTLSAFVQRKLARETIQDILLGIVFGAINGYLIVGTVLYYLDKAGYPFGPFVTPPTEPIYATLIKFLAPNLTQSPLLLSFLVGIAFLVVIVLFV